MTLAPHAPTQSEYLSLVASCWARCPQLIGSPPKTVACMVTIGASRLDQFERSWRAYRELDNFRFTGLAMSSRVALSFMEFPPSRLSEIDSTSSIPTFPSSTVFQLLLRR